jgi:fructose-1,6-bisphosphatase I
VAAGHVRYGTAVVIVYSAGDGVHSFVLDLEIGEFVLDRERLRMPEQGKIFSANLGNCSRWSPPARQFADAFLNDRDRPYFLRYSGALVADLHQILHYGGICFYPEAFNRYEEL